jgi:hypothetical protein
MRKSEQAQFIIGVLIFLLYPVVFTVLGGAYILAGIGLVSAASFGYLLYREICSRCVNFSCPLNNVPDEVREAYLENNPVMGEAWKKAGKG